MTKSIFEKSALSKYIKDVSAAALYALIFQKIAYRM